MILLAAAAFFSVAEGAPVETQIWVELTSPADRERARDAGFAWAEGQEGAWVRLVGTPEMAEALGLRWRPVARALDGWAPPPADVEARLEALVSDQAEVVQVGESAEGEPILGIRIGTGARALRVLGGHHGDEGSSVEVALAVAEAYATGAATLPPDTELWVVPAVNPDGVVAGTRYSARGVDLNRNYGWEWSEDEPGSGESPFSEPETRAIRALTRARSFDAGLTLHSGAENFGWVWNWTAVERPPEEALFEALGTAYAAVCTAPEFWITNGADWYPTRGDTTDWTYGAWGAYDFTLELTEDKSPPEGEVAAYTAWHLAAIEGWIARAPDRSATVYDATTGEPIAATVSGDNVRAITTGPDGRYARWSADPTAALTAWAPGYAPAPLAASTALTPTNLLEALPSPQLLSRGAGPQAVSLPGGGAGPLRLSCPGEADVVIPADAPGTWTVDPEALAPGAWTLTTDAGVVPRALFVGEVSDRVQLDGARVEDDVLVLTGTGFGRGTEAWSIGGPSRAMHALTRRSESATDLRFDLYEEDADVLVWTNGAWLSAVDVHGQPILDETPPGDTGAPPDPTLVVTGGCATAGRASLLLAVLGLLATRGRGAYGLPSGRG